MSTENNRTTEVNVQPELSRWAAEEEAWADPPPLEDLARIARGRTLRRQVLAGVGVVAASAGLWFSAPHLFGTDGALVPAGGDTRVITEEYRDMDQVPLMNVEHAGVPMIVMAEGPSGWTEVGGEGELVQDPETGCLMIQGAAGWPEDGTERAHIVWPPGTTAQKEADVPRVVFASGYEIELGDTLTAGGAIDAEAVTRNIDTPSPCDSREAGKQFKGPNGDAFLTLPDPGL